MVAPQKRGSSVGSPALEDRRNCAEKNLAIEPQGPVVDVELVELLLQLDIRIASFGYLPEAREPRRYGTALVSKFTVHGQEMIFRERTRSDYGHLTCNDVRQLRELVEARRAQEMSDNRQDAWIILELEMAQPLGPHSRVLAEQCFETLLRILIHRPQF